MYIVYETTNLINGKYYIGVHKIDGSDYLGSGLALKAAIKKYGRKNFIRETLRKFDAESSAYDYEKLIIDLCILNNRNCYNICEGGGNPPTFYGKNNPNFGKPMSDEQKKKISNSLKGKFCGKNHPNYGIPMSDEQKKKQSERMKGKNHPNYGIPMSDEQKKKISEGRKGKKHSDETKKLLSEINIGKKHSDETKKKMSESHKGKKHHFYGKHLSREHKEKLSKNSAKCWEGKKFSDDHKKNMRKSKQEYIYFIKGNEYISSAQAGEGLDVSLQTIINWCKSKNRPNCYREKTKI